MARLLPPQSAALDDVSRDVGIGVDTANPAPGVLDALADAELILLPPSNPVVSIGPIVDVPGIRDAIATAAAPVVGVSPIIGGAPVRGMADKLLPAINVPTSATGVGRHYGGRGAGTDGGGLLDGWLVDPADGDATVPGALVRAVPLLMSDVPTAAAIAHEALRLAADVRTGHRQ